MEELKLDLKKQHSKEIDALNEQNLNEMQKMLKDFQQGQAFLKKQISGLEKELQDAALRYTHREPREEDIQTIRELNEALDRYKLKTTKYEVIQFINDKKGAA